MAEIVASFKDKVIVDHDEIVGSVEGEVKEDLEPMEPLPEPPADGGPVDWPMPEFCPLTIDGAVKGSFLETLRKDAELLRETEQSPETRPSSSKRHRACTAAGSPSSKSPYRNILQVFQQCKQDVA